MSLQPLVDGVWTVARPHKMMGLSLGTRMTVVRLPAGGLWIHSPVALDEALRAEVEALGEVRHVVCPNLYHHVYAKEWADAYPEAVVHAPAGLRKKRRDLRVDEDLSERALADWGEALIPLAVEGSMLGETVFVHPASRTVVSSDLVESFGRPDHWPTRMYAKLTGMENRIGMPPPLRLVFRDHTATRRSIDRLLEHDFDRVVIAHGAIVDEQPAQALRQTYSFLRA